MKPLSEYMIPLVKVHPVYKNRRDEIVSRMTEDINLLREGTRFKKVTKRYIAIRANSNPFLLNDGELEMVFRDCEKKRSYAHFFWITGVK